MIHCLTRSDKRPSLTMLMARVRGEVYVVRWRRGVPRSHVLNAIGIWAANPDLNLTWGDAAVMAQTIVRETPK